MERILFPQAVDVRSSLANDGTSIPALEQETDVDSSSPAAVARPLVWCLPVTQAVVTGFSLAAAVFAGVHGSCSPLGARNNMIAVQLLGLRGKTWRALVKCTQRWLAQRRLK